MISETTQVIRYLVNKTFGKMNVFEYEFHDKNSSGFHINAYDNKNCESYYSVVVSYIGIIQYPETIKIYESEFLIGLRELRFSKILDFSNNLDN